MRGLVTLLLLFSSLVSAAGDSIPAVTENELKEYLLFLCHDSLKGRSAGTQQNTSATNYIATKFRESGILPLFDTYLDSIGQRRGEAFPSYNVIGYIPGRSKPGQIVIISAHFDHVPPTSRGRREEIHNGANDNASGTAAMLAMARHYAQAGDNERTIIFCAFNKEELGLLGSWSFADKVNTDSVQAVINLEMLGASQYGKGRLFITGENLSTLGAIFRKNTAGTSIRFTRENHHGLFMRSDNYPFARKGIAAHSFMASDDDWRCYHKACDKLSQLNLPNMTVLVNGILTGISSIVNAVDTPSRIRLK